MEKIYTHLKEKNLGLFIDTRACFKSLPIESVFFTSWILEELANTDQELLGPLLEILQSKSLFQEDIHRIIYQNTGEEYMSLSHLFAQAPTNYHRCVAQVIKTLKITSVIVANTDNCLEKSLEEIGWQYGKHFEVIVDKQDWQNWDHKFDKTMIFKIYGCMSRPSSLVQQLHFPTQGIGVFPANILKEHSVQYHSLYVGLHRKLPYVHTFISESLPDTTHGWTFVSPETNDTSLLRNTKNARFIESDEIRFWEDFCQKAGVLYPQIESLAQLQKPENMRQKIQEWIEKVGRFKAYLIFGDLAELAQEFEWMKNCRLQAEKIAKDQMHAHYISEAFMVLAKSYKVVGDSDTALDFFEKSLQISRKLSKEDRIAYAYICMAETYGEGSPTLGVKHYERGINIFEEISHFAEAANAYLKCGQLYEYKGLLGEAIQVYEKGNLLYQKVGDVCQIGRTYNSIGRVYYLKNDFVQAREYYTKALDLATACGDMASIARIYSNLGVLAQYQEHDPDRALQYYQKASDIFSKIQDASGISTVQHNIALIQSSRQ